MYKQKLEEAREDLYRAIQDRSNMDSGRILELSQEMDKHIYAYMISQCVSDRFKYSD